MSSGHFDSRRGNFHSLRIEAFVCNGKMSGVEKRCSDHSFPVAMGQVFTWPRGSFTRRSPEPFTAHFFPNWRLVLAESMPNYRKAVALHWIG